jgi:hypothetical protein
LDIEKAFDTTWHYGVSYINKLSQFEFSKSLSKIIASFLIDRKFKFLVGGKFSTPRKEQGGFLKDPSLPQYCTVYTKMIPSAAPATQLALFAVDNFI